MSQGNTHIKHNLNSTSTTSTKPEATGTVVDAKRAFAQRTGGILDPFLEFDPSFIDAQLKRINQPSGKQASNAGSGIITQFESGEALVTNVGELLLLDPEINPEEDSETSDLRKLSDIILGFHQEGERRKIRVQELAEREKREKKILQTRRYTRTEEKPFTIESGADLGKTQVERLFLDLEDEFSASIHVLILRHSLRDAIPDLHFIGDLGETDASKHDQKYHISLCLQRAPRLTQEQQDKLIKPLEAWTTSLKDDWNALKKFEDLLEGIDNTALYQARAKLRKDLWKYRELILEFNKTIEAQDKKDNTKTSLYIPESFETFLGKKETSVKKQETNENLIALAIRELEVYSEQIQHIFEGIMHYIGGKLASPTPATLMYKSLQGANEEPKQLSVIIRLGELAFRTLNLSPLIVSKKTENKITGTPINGGVLPFWYAQGNEFIQKITSETQEIRLHWEQFQNLPRLLQINILRYYNEKCSRIPRTEEEYEGAAQNICLLLSGETIDPFAPIHIFLEREDIWEKKSWMIQEENTVIINF